MKRKANINFKANCIKVKLILKTPQALTKNTETLYKKYS